MKQIFLFLLIICISLLSCACTNISEFQKFNRKKQDIRKNPHVEEQPYDESVINSSDSEQ